MAGSKNKAKTVNNISQINLEIDYDKLADAIVRANERAKAQDERPDKKTKTRFFPAIWKIIKGEKSEDGRFLSAPFAIIINALFRTIAIFGILGITLLIIATVYALGQVSWQGWSIASNIVCILCVLGTSIIVFLYMLMFWGAANDVQHEKDKNYVISVFSGLISLAALIVAIIALYKGIG